MGKNRTRRREKQTAKNQGKKTDKEDCQAENAQAKTGSNWSVMAGSGEPQTENSSASPTNVKFIADGHPEGAIGGRSAQIAYGINDDELAELRRIPDELSKGKNLYWEADVSRACITPRCREENSP